MHSEKYDYVVIGSGFGGSVAALRLAEKGYKVLVIEKGKWYHTKDFPKTNMNLKKWLWLPSMRFFGFFKLTFLRHVGILSGVGVGGGSLVYANTLPVPKPTFFSTGSWSKLKDWESTLEPFYHKARMMLGVTPNPNLGSSDLALQDLSVKIGRNNLFEPTDVAIFFGKANETVKDPYFNGKGPDRSGCTFCGACMTGCRENAKNTLDKNYLHLAQQFDCKIVSEQEVYKIEPLDETGNSGYTVHYKNSTRFFKKKKSVTASAVVFAGGVLGTVKLLHQLKKTTMPGLSDQIGRDIRTNNESLIGLPSLSNDKDYTTGIAIGSILHTDKDSHLEPVRYGKGSVFWRFMMLPMTHGKNIFTRIFNLFWALVKSPLRHARILTMWKFSTKTPILLFMQHLDSTLQFKPGLLGLQSRLQKGAAPTADNPTAKKLAGEYAEITNSEPYVTLPESLLGIPTTAHILGGAVMGDSIKDGVIDRNNRVFGYDNLWVCDGSMISANPGVNPSLTITAISEYAMGQIPDKDVL
ncbi:MAG: GMC family oxidoreductase [Bacteroidota bacterium]